MFTLHQLKQIMASLAIIHQSVYAWLNLSFYTLLRSSPLAQLLEHQMKHITSLAKPYMICDVIKQNESVLTNTDFEI